MEFSSVENKMTTYRPMGQSYHLKAMKSSYQKRETVDFESINLWLFYRTLDLSFYRKYEEEYNTLNITTKPKCRKFQDIISR